MFEAMLRAEQDPKTLSQSPIRLRMLTDDRPANEYFALRKLWFDVP